MRHAPAGMNCFPRPFPAIPFIILSGSPTLIPLCFATGYFGWHYPHPPLTVVFPVVCWLAAGTLYGRLVSALSRYGLRRRAASCRWKARCWLACQWLGLSFRPAYRPLVVALPAACSVRGLIRHTRHPWSSERCRTQMANCKLSTRFSSICRPTLRSACRRSTIFEDSARIVSNNPKTPFRSQDCQNGRRRKRLRRFFWVGSILNTSRFRPVPARLLFLGHTILYADPLSLLDQYHDPTSKAQTRTTTIAGRRSQRQAAVGEIHPRRVRTFTGLRQKPSQFPIVQLGSRPAVVDRRQR